MPIRSIIAAIALAILMAVLLVMRKPHGTTSNIPAGSWQRNRMATPDLPKPVMLPIAADAVRLNSPDGNCHTDLDFLNLVIAEYCRYLEGNPVGSNQEISAALRGDNPKNIALLPPNGQFFDTTGRLVDRWGTPYFFHALARQRMDIVSAGPDREFWTSDDVTGSPSGR